MRTLCEASEHQLQEPFTRMQEKLCDATTDARGLSDTIRHTLNKLQERAPFNQLPEESLDPILHWQVEMARKRSRTIEAIACILQGSDEAPEDVIESLPPLELHAWHIAIHKLVSAGYTADVARRGKQIHTHDSNEKRKLRDLNEALNNLARVLSPLLKHAMELVAAREKRRVFEAMRQLLDIHWNDVTERAQAKVQELGLNVNLTVPAGSLEMKQEALTLSYEFTAGFPIGTEVRTEDTGRRVRTVDESTFWRRLRSLVRYPVIKSGPVYADRDYDSADIPSAEKLLKGWNDHAREQDPVLIRQFVEWMFGQFDEAAESLKKSQQALLDRYQDKLNEAHAIAEHAHVETQNVWSGILEQAKELYQCLDRLCCPPSREGR